MAEDIPRTPSSGGGGAHHVKPRIKEIERRMQLRTPDANDGGSRQSPLSPAAALSTPNTTDHGSNKENHAMVLHSPMLARMLPNNSNKIKQFESDVLRRQAEYVARISDLEGRLASVHTRLAVECVEREGEHAFTMEEYVNGPLEQAIRTSLDGISTNFVMPIMDPSRATALGGKSAAEDPSSAEKNEDSQAGRAESAEGGNSSDTTTTRELPNLVSIERHTNLLEAQMNHHQHVTLFHSRRENFDAVDHTCRHTLQPALALEMTKADKRESGMVRRFDSSSGEYTRSVAEMTSSRVSSLGYIEKEIDDWDIGDMQRAENYLDEIRRLKALVVEAREERTRQDEAVVRRIVETKKMLEEDILSACSYGGLTS